MKTFITPPKKCGGVIFSLTAVCLCVCLSVCLSVQHCLWTKSQRKRMSSPIWTRFSLNGCLPHWLKPYRYWWPLVKGQGQWRNSHFFLHNSLLISLLCISALLCSIKMKFGMSLRYTLGRFVFKLHKTRMDYDVIVTSLKFSQNNYPYVKFYGNHKRHTWY